MDNYTNTTFLGGTCGDSVWRDELIPMLSPAVDYFNPQLAPGAWTHEDSVREDACKKAARFNVFGITKDAPSTYSFFEIAEELHKNPERVIFAPLGDLPQISKSSIQVIREKVLSEGGHVFDTLEDLAAFLNSEYEKIAQATAKKKLYISCPMRGRSEDAIRHDMDRMHKVAEATFNQKLEVIPTYIEHVPPETVNRSIWCLGESIKKMSEADYFIGVRWCDGARGCRIEDEVAQAYGIPSTYVDCDIFMPEVNTLFRMEQAEKMAAEQGCCTGKTHLPMPVCG